MSSDSSDGIDVPEEYRQEEIVAEQVSLRQRIVSGILNDKKALFGAVVILILILVAVFAPVIAPYDSGATFDPLKSPDSTSEGDYDRDGEDESSYHLLGTDSLGHDLFTRIVYGSRVSLGVAGATVLLAFTVGTAIGLAAGFYGGWVDDLLMRYIDFQWAFPEIILAVGIIAYAGGLGVWNVILAVGIAYIDDFARIIRGEVLAIREEPYVMAARAVGMKNRRIMTREILPNAIGPLIVQITLMIPLAILSEAGLSFLGLGVKPSTATWGLILSDGRQFISRAWWISILPGLAIMVTVLSFNMMGDGLRDAFDISEEEVEGR